MSSTFGSLTTVKLGIYAAQKGLDVTGNNITNINTNGYTRQRLDQVSLISGGSDRYHSQYNVRVGQGVLVNGVSQLRTRDWTSPTGSPRPMWARRIHGSPAWRSWPVSWMRSARVRRAG